MLPALDLDRSVFGRTTFRLLAFLTIVLAPIGLVAVVQTQALNDELRQQAQDTRLNEVLRTVQGMRIPLDEAIGATKALSAVFDPRSPDCSQAFRALLESNGTFTFAGVVPADMEVTCSSAPAPFSAAEEPVVQRAFMQGRPFADADSMGRVSQKPVIVVGAPILADNGAVEAYTMVSIPQSLFVQEAADREDSVFADASAFLLFNDRGKVLTSLRGLDTVEGRLPSDNNLARLAVNEPIIFAGSAQNGEQRIFTVVPVYDDIIYMMASWPESEFWADVDSGVPAWLFPIFMWLATLLAAYVAINRLVLRHAKFLGLKMRRFAMNRSLPDLGPTDGQPREIAEMDQNFRLMANSIIRDEAELEAAIVEKNVLLREVHHRVKNNLQLIASIMNMQIRKSRNSETGTILRRLQDRVLSLAAVHQNIYRAEALSRISMPDLLEDILNKTFRLAVPDGIEIERNVDLEDISLHPDQAVPLSLLIAEASTNALKYMGTDDTGCGYINVSLKSDGSDALFVFENSKGTPLIGYEEDRQTQTLGTQLINAFAIQLGGEIEVDETADHYCLRLSFPVADYEHQVAEEDRVSTFSAAAQ